MVSSQQYPFSSMYFTYGGRVESCLSHLSLYVVNGLLRYVVESQMVSLTSVVILK